QVIAAAISIDILPEQIHFLHAALGQSGYLGDDVVERPAHFFAARIRYDAKGAVLRTAFHDRYERAGAIDRRLRQTIEFFDFGEGDVHQDRAVGFLGVHHVGHAVQCLRAEDEVDIGRTLADGRAFLAGDAAADADDEAWLLLFQLLPAAELMEHLLLRLFANRAGVEQQYVGLLRVIRGYQPVRYPEQVADPRRVVLVHLAAVGFDVQLFYGALGCSRGGGRRGVIDEGFGHGKSGCFLSRWGGDYTGRQRRCPPPLRRIPWRIS